MKKFWLGGIVLISALFIACSGQFETTISLAEDEEISGSFGSYNYYLQVTQIDKKNYFCYLDAYLSSSSTPDTEQIVLDKETPAKISGFTASLISIRESFTGDKCLIKLSNKREPVSVTGAAARAPPPKPRAATTSRITTTPAQPAPATKTARAGTPAAPSSRASATATTTPSRAGTPSTRTTSITASRAATPATPAQPATGARAKTPATATTPAPRVGTPAAATPAQPAVAAPRAGTPVTPTQATSGARVPTASTQPTTGARADASTPPATTLPRTAAANATSSAPRAAAAQTALALPECADKVDNDEDGLIDWPNDPDCTDRKGSSEGVKQELLIPTISQCSDGIDNDGDGLIDYDQELVGCETPEDDDETDSIGETMEKTEEETAPSALQCADGIDNDGDGLIDYAGGDPGCSGEADSSEEDYIPEEPSGGGGISAAPSAPAPSEAPSVQEAPPEELPPEEQPIEEKKSEAQQTVAESTVIGKAEKTIERLTKGETIVIDTSHIISEIKSVEMTARKEVHGAAFKIEKTEKSVIPPPTLKNIISTFHIEGPESDKVIDIKVELSKYTAKTTANCFDTKKNKWRPGKVKEKKSDEKYVYLKVALPCRN